MGHPTVAFGKGAQQVPRLRSPGFPVELVGVGEPHAAFLTESRTRSHGWSHVQEIRVGTTKGRAGLPQQRLLRDGQRGRRQFCETRLASRATKAGCPIQARFWLEWDTTVLRPAVPLSSPLVTTWPGCLPAPWRHSRSPAVRSTRRGDDSLPHGKG
jgi:hypothetical protein